MKVSIIAAIDDNFLIGKRGGMPWYLPSDLKHFKETTMGHTIIMGRKTHESIRKPLPGRINIIVTRNPKYKSEGCVVVNSLEKALDYAKNKNETEAFIIGGGEIYEQALPFAEKLYLTQIHHTFEGDVYFPKLDMKKWKMVSCDKYEPDSKNPYSYEFCVFERLI